MRESREIEIKRKRFRLADIVALAELFVEQANLSRKGKRNFNVSFSLRCRDGTSYQSETPLVFSEEGGAGAKPPQAIEMSFSDYELHRRMTLTAVHGGAYSDRFFVSGDDAKWVHDVFLRIRERLDALESTGVWFTQHPLAAGFLGQLGIGCILHLLVVSAVDATASLWRPSPETIEQLRQSIMLRAFAHPFFQIPFAWFCRWLMGGVWWACCQQWLMSAYPSIDLDFGPEHMKVEALRRRRIRQFLLIVAVPLCVAFLHDMMRVAAR